MKYAEEALKEYAQNQQNRIVSQEEITVVRRAVLGQFIDPGRKNKALTKEEVDEIWQAVSNLFNEEASKGRTIKPGSQDVNMICEEIKKKYDQ